MASKRQGRRTPQQQALALLTRREHSQYELAGKLRARGCNSDEIDETLARLTEDGWQSDARFAEALIRHRAACGYGPRWIRAELATHKLEHALIESALDGFEGDWPQIAQALLARRNLNPPEDGSPWPLPQKRKAMELLLRRGFEHTVIMVGSD